MKNITHLAFSGAGLKSLSLLGVIRYIYFYKLDNKIYDILGTSMGSYIGLLFALKISYEKIEELIKNISKDESVIYIHKNNISDLFLNNGMDSAKCYTDYVKKYLNIEDLTFIELSKKYGINFYVSSTNINLSCNTIFSINNTPNVSIFDAVASSMTIPFISKPVYIDGYFYVDGGLTNNFPIFIFDKIPKDNILGAVVGYNSINNFSEDIPKNTSNLSFIDYSKKIFNILLYNFHKETYYNNIKDDENILNINDITDVNFVQFELNKDYLMKKMTDDEIDYLIILGYNNMFNYMKKFE